MELVISNHSPFVKVWVIIQLIAKHLNWWMWIGYQLKFNMLHLKVSHWMLGDSFCFSNKIRSFSGSIRWSLGGLFAGCGEGSEGILMLHPTVHCLGGGSPRSYSNDFGNKHQLVFSLDQCKEQKSCLIIPRLSRFLSVQTQWAPWDKHVNRKCKACGLCMSQWVLIYTYIVYL